MMYTIQQENFEDQNLCKFHEQMTICEINIHIIAGCGQKPVLWKWIFAKF